MKIAVIGAGMAGVAAAQALASDGHDVTVIERRSSVAEETSFAPAGIAAAGLAAPWLPAPGRLQALAGSADEAEPAARHRRRVRRAHAVRQGRRPRGRAPRRARAGAAQAAGGGRRAHRRPRPRAVARLRTRRRPAADAGRRRHARRRPSVAVAWLQQAGETAEWADAARQRQIEPGRAVADDAPRAVYLPNARIGNTREWTQLLRAHAQHLGVRFLFQHEVASISAGPQPTVGFAAANEPARADDRSTPSSSAPRSSRRACSRRWA